MLFGLTWVGWPELVLYNSDFQQLWREKKTKTCLETEVCLLELSSDFSASGLCYPDHSLCKEIGTKRLALKGDVFVQGRVPGGGWGGH